MGLPRGLPAGRCDRMLPDDTPAPADLPKARGVLSPEFRVGNRALQGQQPSAARRREDESRERVTVPARGSHSQLTALDQPPRPELSGAAPRLRHRDFLASPSVYADGRLRSACWGDTGTKACSPNSDGRHDEIAADRLAGSHSGRGAVDRAGSAADAGGGIRRRRRHETRDGSGAVAGARGRQRTYLV